jgi:anthranilate synthase component 1
MLIDLERNDLGRVCVPGSVRVDELMAVESYAHVHHIVSNVRGDLREGVGPPGRCWRRCSPAAPSPAARRCAACRSSPSLEGEGRGPYTGALGYLRPRRRHGPEHP